ncbi:hypothetical protein [Micromonospora sp. DT31]|uniref:hypothetical protein n=1 Tax=Micromonospora sp. DT31 TaxID=3393434 RepID=UPI003CE77343
MTEHDYSAATITVLDFDDSVRKRPGLYFGVGREDPRLATRVLLAVVTHAFHPATRVAASHTPDVVAEITADLAFSVTDDQADVLTGQGLPKLGYYDSLLTSDRLSVVVGREDDVGTFGPDRSAATALWTSSKNSPDGRPRSIRLATATVAT